MAYLSLSAAEADGDLPRDLSIGFVIVGSLTQLPFTGRGTGKREAAKEGGKTSTVWDLFAQLDRVFGFLDICGAWWRGVGVPQTPPWWVVGSEM